MSAYLRQTGQLSLMLLVSFTGTASAQAVKPAAVVNGEAIPMAELEAALGQAEPSAVAVPEEQKKANRRQALAMLIDEALMHQFLNKNTPAATPAEVNKKLTEMEEDLKKQGKSLAEFYRVSGQTEAKLREGIAYSLRWQAYARKQISDAAVQQYYAAYKDFFDGTTVKASHIVLRVAPDAPEADQKTARLQLGSLRGELLAGRIDFAAAAKKYSQCPSAPNGGDIGFFPRKWVVDEAFAKAAFAMKAGEISDVVQTAYGLHLIKVTERKPGQGSDFAKIKDEVRDFYTEEVRQNWLGQMRHDAKIDVNIP